MMPDIHAIILTLNEEQHIERCITSIQDECTTITVIDSGSTDRTVELAQALGAEVHQNAWVNYATQMNFAIRLLAGRNGWLLRIDADELLDANSSRPVAEELFKIGTNINGLLVQRRIYFLGRRIKYGAIEPSWQLRLWRNGTGRCEQRWMDEYIQIVGGVAKSAIIISDKNNNPLTWWTNKHNNYASREAIDLLNSRFGFIKETQIERERTSSQATTRRFLKNTLYLHLPSGTRSLLYFLYRYIIRLGFLDGKEGFYFHLMQGLWYRTLVDAKIHEIIQHATEKGLSIPAAIHVKTGINPTPSELSNSHTKIIITPTERTGMPRILDRTT